MWRAFTGHLFWHSCSGMASRVNACGRHATLEDDGYSAWLYLTSQSKSEVIADCFVYSRVELPEFRVMPLGKSGPPLLLREFATPAAVQRSVLEDSLRVEFSLDG